MKKTRLTENQIVQALKEYEGGKKAEAIYREPGVTKAMFHNRNKRYSGMDGEQLKRLKELEEENRKLKVVLSKKW